MLASMPKKKIAMTATAGTRPTCTGSDMQCACGQCACSAHARCTCSGAHAVVHMHAAVCGGDEAHVVPRVAECLIEAEGQQQQPPG
eukprot:scaffold2367_cov58-Phaeocystis_antarctica.AAC.12